MPGDVISANKLSRFSILCYVLTTPNFCRRELLRERGHSAPQCTMVPSLCVLAFAFLPWPRPATTRVSSVAYLGAGGDSGRGRGRGRADAAVSPLALARASRPRRHPASRACVEDLGQLTVPQLKQRLRAAGLKVSGRKAELVQRLLGTDTASSTEAELGTDGAASIAESPDAASSTEALLGTESAEAPLGSPAAAASAEVPLVSPDAAASAEAHGTPGSSTDAVSSVEVQGATGLHPGASLPTSTFSLVHADASLLVVDKGAGTQVVTRRLSCQYLRRVSYYILTTLPLALLLLPV